MIAGAFFGPLTGLVSAVEVAGGGSIGIRAIYFVGGAIGGVLFGFEAGVVRDDEGETFQIFVDCSLAVIALGMAIVLIAAL